MRRSDGWALATMAVLFGGGCLQIIGYDDARRGWSGGGEAGASTTSSSTGGAGGTAPTCTDGKRNGDETGKDCGGGTCPACPLGEGCVVGTDCESKACSPNHVCVPPQCNDQVKNGAESDIDCGGDICPLCANGQACTQDADCVSNMCSGGSCTAQCNPDDTRCMGNTPQTCDASWQWKDGVACDGTTPQCCAGGCLAVAAELAVGQHHACARQTDGTLWCWGLNSSGQLGDGTTMNKSPTQVMTVGTNAAAISAGGGHTCARKPDGTLWCWGLNSSGQLGDGTTVNKSSPVQVTALGTSVADVAAGGGHTCARKGDGTLWCWGSNASGQLGDGTTVNKSSPVQVTALGATVAEFATGSAHTCARKVDGTVWCWGFNFFGGLGDGTTADKSSPVQVAPLGANIAEIAVGSGSDYTCARKTDGTLWCWGNNASGQLGDGTTVNKSSPVQVTALGTTVAEVAPGGTHTCARKIDNTLWCWGRNLYGKLGDGTTVDKPAPVQVTALGTDVAEVAAGLVQTCARKVDGTVWCWGLNSSSQLGDGTTLSPWILPKRLSLGACEVDGCGNGVKDGDETDVDCGGSTCNALGKTCWQDKTCAANEDCASRVCTGGLCQAL